MLTLSTSAASLLCEGVQIFEDRAELIRQIGGSDV